MLCEGVVNSSEHVARYNDFLKEYYGYGQEARLADMQTVSKEFWAGDNYQRQPYIRGLLLHNWHARIRRQTNNEKGLNVLIPPLVSAGFKQPVTLDHFQTFSQTLLKEGGGDDVFAKFWRENRESVAGGRAAENTVPPLELPRKPEKPP